MPNIRPMQMLLFDLGQTSCCTDWLWNVAINISDITDTKASAQGEKFIATSVIPLHQEHLQQLSINQCINSFMEGWMHSFRREKNISALSFFEKETQRTEFSRTLGQVWAWLFAQRQCEKEIEASSLFLRYQSNLSPLNLGAFLLAFLEGWAEY